MARYVNLENLDVSAYVTVWDCDCSEFGSQTVMAVDDLHYLPTVEAEPVRHGRWEDRGGLLMPMHKNDEFTNPDSIFYGTCSVCGITVYQSGILNGFNYCPNCGAKMDGKEGKG